MKSPVRTSCTLMFLLLTAGLAGQANAYVISDLAGTPTEGWDGPGLGPATINYFLGWNDAPDGAGLLNSGLSLEQLEQEAANAAATWSSAADIIFNYLGNAIDDPILGEDPWGSPGNETIVIYFHENEAENDIAFDGAGLGTVFAHAYGPPDIMGGLGYQFAGNIHLDAEENWLTGLADGTSYSSVGGIDLETILLHEFGHSLGLGHSSNTFASPGGSVMAAFSNQAVSTLGSDDILGIRQLYSFDGDEGDPDQDPIPVPEPGTLSLLALGLIAGARAGRRSRLG